MKQDLTPSIFLLFIQPAINVASFLFLIIPIVGAMFDDHDIHYKSLSLNNLKNL